MFLLSWILYPAALAAICLGCGLLVHLLGRHALPRVLILPVGFAAMVVVATVLTVLDATAELAAPALVVAALVGVALALRRDRTLVLPSASWWWPAVAMALPFTALALPVVLTGMPGLSGYVRIVDLAAQIDLASFLVDHGRSLAGTTPDSSYSTFVDRLLRAGYPGGAQAALGATAQIARIDTIWAWQPFIAWMGAMLGLALYVLLHRAIPHRAARALGAGVAAQPTILYSYALVAGIKELAAGLFVALTAALLVAVRGAWLPAGLTVAAGLCVVNVGIAPWVLVLIAVLAGPRLLAAARRPSRLRLGGRTWLPALLAVVVVTVPTIVAAAKLAPLLRAGGPADLGNLAAPVPFWSAIGPWLTSDHRYPLATNVGAQQSTAFLVGFVAVFATLGLARAISRRDRGLYAAAAAAVLAVVAVIVTGSSWVELKAFTISSPLIVALAFAGAAALSGAGWRRLEATVAGVAVAAAILAGNVLTYRNMPVTPYERFADLDRLGDRYAGQGPALYPAFEEFAGYLMRNARLTALADVPDEVLTTPPQATPRFAENLDSFLPAYLNGFKLLVVRRGDPAQSRPPSNWELAESTSYHDVYRRVPSARAVIAHLGLPAGSAARPPAYCRSLREALSQAGPSGQVAYVAPIDGTIFVPPANAIPATWPPQGDTRLARGAGRVVFGGSVGRGGEFDVWIGGSFGRRVAVSVDGREVGSVRWQENYPQAFEPVGRAALEPGVHRFDIVRGGGSLLPGTGNELGLEGIITRIGTIALIRRGARPPVRVVGGRAGMDVCRDGRPLDWMEVVRPG